MSQTTVRPVASTDMPAITAIYRPDVTEGLASWEYDPPDAAEMARRCDAVRAAGYPYLVAERAGIVVGYAYASAYRTRPGYRYCVENSVYVSSTAQRSGAGRLLLGALISHCAEAGFRQMIAVIGDSGNHASIGLHRALGFTFCGTIHAIGWKHGRWLYSVLMQRTLGPGDTSPPGGKGPPTR